MSTQCSRTSRGLRCTQVAVEGRKLCPYHRDLAAKWRLTEIERARNTSSKCSTCSYGTAVLGMRTCQKCRTKNKTKKMSTSTKERLAQRRKDLLERVITAYGHRCVCCGEHSSVFLTLDHVMGDGAEHKRERRRLGESANLYEWAEIHYFPDNLQLLCWNCNCARFYRGSCH